MLHYILAQVSIQYFKKNMVAFWALVMSARLLFHGVPWLFILNIVCFLFYFHFRKFTTAATMKPTSLCFARRGEV